MDCPQCGTWLIRRAHFRGSVEFFLGLLTLFPFCCQLCRHRFLGFAARPTSSSQREYQRILTHFPVTLWPVASPNQETGVPGVMVDFSISGCGIASKMSTETGSRVRLMVDVSDRESPLEVDQAVVCNLANGRIGLEFQSLRPAEEERLRRLVELRLNHLPTKQSKEVRSALNAEISMRDPVKENITHPNSMAQPPHSK